MEGYVLSINSEDSEPFYLDLQVLFLSGVPFVHLFMRYINLGGVVGYSVTTYNKETKQPVIGFDMV
jgi:hypothetical protein